MTAAMIDSIECVECVEPADVDPGQVELRPVELVTRLPLDFELDDAHVASAPRRGAWARP